MYKLIALDLDGTLLRSDKTISPRTQQALSQARAQGVKVVLASGRPPQGMYPFLQQLGIKGDNEFVVSFNGSWVTELVSHSLVHRSIVDGQTAKMVAKLAQETGLDCHAFSETLGLITPKLSRYTDVECRLNGLTATEMDFAQLDDDHPVIKAMIVGEPSLLTPIRTQLPAHIHQQYAVVQSAPFFLEFLNPASSKGAAIESICQRLGIAAEHTICIGDAQNDHAMIEFAGLGVAMANGMEETRQLADMVTDSNDDDGVAKIIEQFLLR